MTGLSNLATQETWQPRLSDFAFFGFDDLRPQLERNIRRVEIRGGTPSVEVVDDFLYVPKDQSGLLRREREALVRGDELFISADPAVTIDEDVVYLGWLFNHYGHFLMQSLARVWALADVPPSVKVIFHHSNAVGVAPAKWAQRMLAAFGVPPERMLSLDTPTRLRRVIVPEPLFAPRSVADDQTVRVHEAMARPYQEVAARLAPDATVSTQPLYLSRRRLPSSQRLMVGEDQLEELLRQNGFRVVSPETMSLEDQVRLINSHADIVSNAGSAAQNVLFARQAPRLHLLTNGAQFSPDYFMHRTLVGSPTTFVNALGTGQRGNFPQARKLTPHLIDLPTCVAYLQQQGLLSNQEANWSVDSEQLEAQYDEAWIYGHVRVVGQRNALPETIEQEAVSLAAQQWPVSLALARYYCKHEPSRVDGLARQFVAQAMAEVDGERLRRYQGEVAEMAPFVARRCTPETATRLRAVLADRFAADRLGAP